MKYTDLINLKDNQGATLKNYKEVNYKTGYQVATEGKETRNSKMAIHYIKEYNGNCGIWKSNGVYYIDKSHRESKLNTALKIAKDCSQQSILKWNDKSLIWC